VRRTKRIKPPLGWKRVDTCSGKLFAVWTHPSGWWLQHCGHPTALHPWMLRDPQGRMLGTGATRGHPEFGTCWNSLADAWAYVEGELARSGYRLPPPRLDDLPLFASLT
jgi:hypothetical protein